MKILIVDDAAENIRTLTSILSSKYKISAATSGKRALEITAENKDFDIFLLDIMMPGMDGIELCRQLKSQSEFADIPVIFISGLSDIRDKKSAFGAGGVDYIVKPFEKEEVLLRVDTHLRIRQLQKELREKNRELEDNYKRLRELERLRDNLTNMIVHDMRSPLTGVISMFEILRVELGQSEKKELLNYIDSGYRSARNLLEMINSLLDIARLEEGKLPLNIKENSVSEIIDEALNIIRQSFRGDNIVQEGDEEIKVSCDADLIRRVIINLIINSLRHSQSKSPVRIVVQKHDSEVMISVIDNGIGIPEEHQSKIFDKFGLAELRQERKRYSTGLGLAFCKLAVEAHKGKIGVESKVGEGSRFYFILPLK